MPAVVFDHQDSRVACFPHIINICVQHTLKALAKPARASDDESDNASDDESDEDSDEDERDAHDKVPDDLLAKVRRLIKAIRASGQRQSEFAGVIDSGNNAGWWKDSDDKSVRIKPLKFILDVRTRWDSTYQMLIRLRMFKQVRQIIFNCSSFLNCLFSH